MKQLFEEYFSCKCPTCGKKLKGNALINKYHCNECGKTYRRVYHSPLLPVLYTMLSTIEKFLKTQSINIQQTISLLFIGTIVCVLIELIMMSIFKDRPYEGIL